MEDDISHAKNYTESEDDIAFDSWLLSHSPSYGTALSVFIS